MSHIKVFSILPVVMVLACSSDKTDTSDADDSVTDSRTETEGTFAGECADGADNDSDGLYDCDDPDCAGAPDCQDAGETDCDDTGDHDCPEGWATLPEAGSCVQLQAEAKSWQDAQADCNELGGHLVTITNTTDDTFLAELLGEEGRAWIGYNDLEEEGTWVWDDGSASGYENWGGANPDQDGDEDCAWMKLDFGPTDPGVGWGDQECETTHKSICML